MVATNHRGPAVARRTASGAIAVRRRRFLQGAAALGGAALLDQFVRPVLAAGAVGTLHDIDHFVFLMKENRSFDHYFGTLSGVRGFDDTTATRLPDGRPVFAQTDDQDSAPVLPFRLDTTHTNAQRLHVLDHSWQAQHQSWNGGKMNLWIPAHRAADGAAAPLTMGFLARADLPFYYALSDAFTICDNYHCSVMGPTHPNRYYAMSGTIDPDGQHGGPAIDNNGQNYSWETYPERLQKAGVSWRIYHDLDDYGCNVCKYFVQYRTAPKESPLREAALRNRPFYELLWDLRTGNIPQVTWIVPPSFVSEHPDWLPAAGEHHTQLILAALWSNPKLWARTAVILHFDENDGQFDHVTPPTPPPGTADEYIGGLPIGLGFRVPCLIISPWTRGGYVFSQVLDHTSSLRLLEARFGVEVPNLSRWRRAVTGDMTGAFSFGLPPRIDIPVLPDTGKALRAAEDEAMALPLPASPETPVMPRQEPGSRPHPVAAS
ncbi:MAG: phospholipase [Alphaproteobacteria bacterium]|nr:phospholipase [Alphaproteobacteria bacterium]